MKKLFIVAMIAVFGGVGGLPSATVVGSSSAYAAQTGKIKKKHGYKAQTTGKKKSKMKKATGQM